MIDAIREECARTGQAQPQNIGQIMQCIYMSLARCYHHGIQQLESLTGKKYTSINIVGGGCQDQYLNALTARATGLRVHAGPVEGTAIGNLVVQMVSYGDLNNIETARNIIRESFPVTVANS